MSSSLRQAIESHSHHHHQQHQNEPLLNLPKRSSNHHQHYPLPAKPDQSGNSTNHNTWDHQNDLTRDHTKHHHVVQQPCNNLNIARVSYNEDRFTMLAVKKKKSSMNANNLDDTSKDPCDFNDDAKSSSGSVHDDLAAMVNEFIEDADADGHETSDQYLNPIQSSKLTCNHDHLNESANTSLNHDGSDAVLDEYDGLIQAMEGLIMASSSIMSHAKDSDKEEAQLRRDVMEALEKLKNNVNVHTMLSYGVMRQLRAMGYNAAICKSKWEKALGSLPSGNYEYIDVILSTRRIVVDIDFRAQFELARASEQYHKLLEMVPCTFVGKGEMLKAIIKTMSEGAKLSLRLMGMHLPPWRKQSYLQAKWFSSYKRTTKSSIVFGKTNDKPNPARRLGSIALKEPFLSSRFKVELEDLYGYKRPASKPSLSSTTCLQVHPRAGERIASDWQPPALVYSSRLALHQENVVAPTRKVSALAHALRQHSQQATGGHALNQHRTTPTRAIAC